MRITKLFLYLLLSFILLISPAMAVQSQSNTIEQWGIFEAVFQGPSDGNPFVDVSISGVFQKGDRSLKADGFYDGDGIYRLRFMPDEPGQWRYRTTSNRPELDGKSGVFVCSAASKANHGIVRVRETYHFGYADGTPYYPFGTTCYAWIHQGDTLAEKTLATLKNSPFNKMRMCVFPKHYDFNNNEPPRHPFMKDSSGKWDYSRFNPDFFRNLEKRVGELRDIGVEADIILFHPYDCWGYSNMGAVADERYLNYVVARLAAYRNVWWSMANEYDLMLQNKPMEQWDKFFQIVQEKDPYQHLRSVHNCGMYYDYTKPWVTHACIQDWDVRRMPEWRKNYRKPVIDDELEYEGNINLPWGSITAQELTNRFWMCCTAGGYAGHGETYMDKNDVLWWSKGGVLKGESPKRLAFLRKIIEAVPQGGLEPMTDSWVWGRGGLVAGKCGEFRLIYFGRYQPSFWNIGVPEKSRFKADVIDTWNMTITPLDKVFEPNSSVPLPGKPFMALRLTPVQ